MGIRKIGSISWNFSSNTLSSIFPKISVSCPDRIAESRTTPLVSDCTCPSRTAANASESMLRHYSDIASKGNVTFIEDICANAKGYEYLAMQKQRRQTV